MAVPPVPTKGDKALDAITDRLEALNIRMADAQADKAERVMPAATARQAAGNASS